MSFLLIIPWGICSQVDYFSLFFLKKKKKDFINLAQISTSTHCKSLKIVYYHGNLEYTVIEIYYIQVKSQEGSFKWWFNSPAFLKVCECYENVTQRLSLHWWTGLLFSPNGTSSFSFDSHLQVLGFVVSRYFEKSAWGSLLVLCDSPHCGDCWAMSLVATSTIWGQPHSPHTVHSHGHSTDQLQCVPPSPSQDRTRLWFVIQTNPSFEVLFARPASIPYSELSKCHRACRALLACTEDDSHRHSCHCHPPQEWRAVVLEHLQLVLESVPTGSEQSSCDVPPPWDSQETNCSPMNASCKWHPLGAACSLLGWDAIHGDREPHKYSPSQCFSTATLMEISTVSWRAETWGPTPSLYPRPTNQLRFCREPGTSHPSVPVSALTSPAFLQPTRLGNFCFPSPVPSKSKIKYYYKSAVCSWDLGARCFLRASVGIM